MLSVGLLTNTQIIMYMWGDDYVYHRWGDVCTDEVTFAQVWVCVVGWRSQGALCTYLSCKMLLLGDETSGGGKLLGTGGGMVRTRRWYRLPEIPNKRAHTHTRHAEYSYKHVHISTFNDRTPSVLIATCIAHTHNGFSFCFLRKSIRSHTHKHTHLNIQCLYVICDCCDKMCTYP